MKDLNKLWSSVADDYRMRLAGTRGGEKGKDRKKTSGGEGHRLAKEGGKKTIGEDNRERAKDRRWKR